MRFLFATNVFLAAGEMNDFTVAGIGFVTVLLSLAILSTICALMTKLFRLFSKKEKKEEKAPADKTQKTQKGDPLSCFADRKEAVAAISAAIAEDMGEDISKIRIVSIEKIG